VVHGGQDIFRRHDILRAEGLQEYAAHFAKSENGQARRLSWWLQDMGPVAADSGAPVYGRL
jgi:hypothetical protein